jgi:hypothetical protein
MWNIRPLLVPSPQGSSSSPKFTANIIIFSALCTYYRQIFNTSPYSFVMSCLTASSTQLTNNSIEPSPFWEATSRSATQEFANILWNQEVHYRVHKCPPMYPILNHTNPVHITRSQFSKVHFNIIIHLRLGFPSGLFVYGFSIKIKLASST